MSKWALSDRSKMLIWWENKQAMFDLSTIDLPTLQFTLIMYSEIIPLSLLLVPYSLF